MAENRSKSDGFMLRLPDGMRERIKDKAEANGRSMNAEIVDAIEAALDQPDLSAPQLRALLDEERTAYTRVEALYENAIEVAHGYRDLLRSARGEIGRYVGMIKSLASILLTIESAPTPDIIDVAQRMEAAALGVSESLAKRSDLDELKAELKKTDELIERADRLLGKAKG